MMSLWPALFGVTREEVRAAFPVYQHFEGKRTAFVSDIISRGFGLHGYELQLKEDEIIAKIGTDLRVADWLETNINAARDRVKDRAKIRAVVMYVSITLLTYGIARDLGISAKVETEMAAAKTQYVKGSLWAKLRGWLKVIEAGLKAFMTAIHYDTLYHIHRIAYLVSEDYRQTLNKFYREISKASEALGFGPYYLQLFIQSMRVIILDVSTSMGRSYDVAQMEWYATLDEYLEVFNTRAYRYKGDPGLLLYDLEQLVERPALDTKASGARALFDSLAKLLQVTEESVYNIKKISDDLDQMVFNLPENIRKEVEPFVSKYTEKVDNFIVDVYEPYIGTLNNIIVAIRGQNESLRGDLSGVISRLAKPADYLLEIDGFDWADKYDQESKIGELASRKYKDEAIALSGEVQVDYEHLSTIAEALATVTLVPTEFPTEQETPITPAGEEPEPRETWFVGDY